ncbi:MAG: energy transducer TonB, partial [Mucilaginibacter sp.]
NADGSFSINAPVNDSVLDIAYVGYNPLQVKASKQENLKVELVPNSQALSEVVVVGYGSTKANSEAAPIGGWDAYNTYLKQAAVMSTGETGKVKLSFTVAPNGTISDIQVISGDNKTMNDKAIDIILNGPKWIGGSKPKIVKLKIVFHKKA